MLDTTIPIPSPPAIPFIWHLNVLDRDLPIKSLNLLAQQYGEIFQLNILGADLLSQYECAAMILIIVTYRQQAHFRLFL